MSTHLRWYSFIEETPTEGNEEGEEHENKKDGEASVSEQLAAAQKLIAELNETSEEKMRKTNEIQVCDGLIGSLEGMR